MNFAINFSHPVAALLDAGLIELDRIKTPDWPHMVAEASQHCPVAVHFSLQAGRGGIGSKNWDAVEELLERTGTPYVNLHLSPTTEDFPGVLPESPTPGQAGKITAQMLRDVTAAVERFGPQRVIVENTPYHAARGKILRTAVEPETIERILTETGCSLLLDISHARISAHYMGIDEREYLSSLPTYRLCEMHITGLDMLEGLLQDHMPVTEQDWPVLAWVLERIRKGEWARPWMVAFEYGGVGGWYTEYTNPDVIAGQVPRLYEMVKSIS